MKTSDHSNHILRAEAELVITDARRQKSERTKFLGSPIQLPGIALAIQIRGGDAWIAENTTVTRKIDIETGKTLQIYRGHTGPVTCLSFCDKVLGSGDNKILITGSWDKTIKLWNTDTRALISSTPAHSDFVKCLFVIPSLNLLVSGSSDKIVRYWDLSAISEGAPLSSLGYISSHTRPVECVDGFSQSATSAVLYTADTMGVIKVWDIEKDHIEKDQNSSIRWRSTLKTELNHHRTRINEMLVGNGQLWTASSDETVQIVDQPLDPSTKPVPPITHQVAVRSILPLSLTDLREPYIITGAGDIIRVYDVSTLEKPELVGEVDAHWHDVTALRLWVRKTVEDDGKTRVEPWIISASLDGTIRKWKLQDLLNPSPIEPTAEIKHPPAPPKSDLKDEGKFEMTEEEERELAELLDSD
ncbi:hypothetical protein PILCRDRAFT_284328 [Piloderma croceum F 1598]|uniref:Uncharacterized protein n=1 Tax=Piloderma croceum (strain F 1598) TaxID=765440 RepID=A0A0C3G783_PILCF|nr:hypothetical protein PILCRDRAFT_284328 [Piloderma croceum F 1598]